MAKYQLKNQMNAYDATQFINSIDDTVKREDCLKIIEIMEDVTKMPPKMWGKSIIGFGSYHYKYESGHEGDMCRLGFSPRKAAITIYLAYHFEEGVELINKLGKHKTGKGCLYIKRLSDVDIVVLKNLFIASEKYMKKKYP